MDIFNSSSTQISDQIAQYENKIKLVKEKIKEELKNRQSLKEKLNEAKKREVTQILILERLDEYEEIVTKQLEAAEKMEDSESVKQLAVIEKYETMLREQQQVWATYEEKYEQLPLAKDKRTAETQLLKVIIQNKLADYRINEVKRMIRTKETIARRQEQLKIVELAKLYLEHRKRENHCQELIGKVRNLKIKERELKLEVQDLERQAAAKKKSAAVSNKAFLKSKELPKVDLSCFIIRRDNRNYNNYDTLSINSYILEQEYMNIDEPTKQSSQPLDQTMNIDSQEKNTEESSAGNSEPMEVDSQEHSKQNKVFQSTAGANKEQDKRMDVDTYVTRNSQELHSNQSAQAPKSRNYNGEANHEQRVNSNQQSQASKRSNEDSQGDKEADRSVGQKRTSQQHSPSNAAEAVPARGYVSVTEEWPSMVRVNDRPSPSPAKLQMRQAEHHDPRYNQQHKSTTEAMLAFQDVLRQSETGARAGEFVQQRESPNATRQDVPNSAARSNLVANNRPQANLDNSSIFSASMLNVDVNAYGDNISAILGSEITEPGGSLELARRIYGDSDLNSEDGDYDYTKMMEKFFSPIPGSSNDYQAQQQKQQQHQQQHQQQNNQANNQMHIDMGNNSAANNQQQNITNFTLGGFVKKQTNATQRFF